jgi:predicted nucleic acid-binding protein
MILVDTSVWIDILTDKTGRKTRAFKRIIGRETYVLSRFNQWELLQVAKDQKEWDLLEKYLSTQIYLETSQETWSAAARIYFDLRRNGLTVHSPIDCCIAQLVIEHGAILLHRDKDYVNIAKVCPLMQKEWNINNVDMID